MNNNHEGQEDAKEVHMQEKLQVGFVSLREENTHNLIFENHLKVKSTEVVILYEKFINNANT